MIHQRFIRILTWTVMALVMPSLASAAPKKPARAPKVFITVSLSKNLMTIQKNTKRGASVLTAPIIPIAPGTVRPGTFKALRMTDRYKSRDGNVMLENVVRVEGEFNIRTTRMFSLWKESGRPANRAIVLEAETGSLLFTTIRHYGIDRTQIRVIP